LTPGRPKAGGISVPACFSVRTKCLAVFIEFGIETLGPPNARESFPKERPSDQTKSMSIGTNAVTALSKVEFMLQNYPTV
jgi:hypothetical protein